MTDAHTCGQCNESFSEWGDLDAHLSACETWACSCGKTYTDYGAYLSHRPCSERGEFPTQDRMSESERLERRRERMQEDKRARDGRLGLRRGR